ncbi:MAG: CRISPR-associated RAMP protein [Clostridiales bacterium]|jgi:CRISPR-associated RAMP protein (TIGR02581 family)|nr:CRISPR-associated RAMP protein [Clostridiales bacterium]
MFHQFRNRIVLKAVLTAETALYIGSGQDSFEPLAVQGCLMKNQAGFPYIPGSSLKGVLRSFLESVIGGSCERGDCGKSLKGKKERQDKIEELLKLSGNAGKDKNYLLAEHINKISCMACRLFGSNLMAGKLKIADATLLSQESWLGTDLRTGNAIDRDTHTVASYALFDTETIPAGTEFRLHVIAENLTMQEAECFGQLMSYFAKGGITVGGRSRAGLGEVTADNFQVTVSHLKSGSFIPVAEELADITIGTLAQKLVGSLIPDKKEAAADV